MQPTPNKSDGRLGWPVYLGLALISAAVLGLEVTFTRIFYIMIWYHFAYLVIGVALLGGGAAATFLALRGWNEATLRHRLGPIALGFSLSILLGLTLVTHLAFDPLTGRAEAERELA